MSARIKRIRERAKKKEDFTLSDELNKRQMCAKLEEARNAFKMVQAWAAATPNTTNYSRFDIMKLCDKTLEVIK